MNPKIIKLREEHQKNKAKIAELRKLGKLDYRMLLSGGDDSYSNDEINKKFQECNRKHGLNLKFDDEHAERTGRGKCYVRKAKSS